MICCKCTGFTELNKKKVFIVMGDRLEDIAIKASNYSFKNSSLHIIKKVTLIEVIGDTEDNTLIL